MQTSSFLTEALQLLDTLLGNPDSFLESMACLGVFLLVLGSLFPKIARGMDARNASGVKGWMLAIVVPALLLGAATFIKISVVPSITGGTLQTVALIGGVVLVLLLVVAPLMKVVFTCPYVGSVLTCLATFLCAALAALIVHLGFSAMSIGESTKGAIENRAKDLNE